MTAHQGLKKLTLDEFKKEPAPKGLENVLDMLRGGTFMECHTQIYESTGIWVEDLVPVFQKLDAILVARKLGP
ncbi:hypothetical protein [Paraburkholderia strydomiana]